MIQLDLALGFRWSWIVLDMDVHLIEIQQRRLVLD
jgi:hypothetical protein